MLLEMGFGVTSSDASDKMLKYALKERWSRRREEAFDSWGKNDFYKFTKLTEISHAICKLRYNEKSISSFIYVYS